MPKFVARDYKITVNSVDLTDHCSALAVTDTADQVDATTFGPNAYKQYLQGFHDCQITATFFSDFAAASVHATLLPLYQSGSVFPVKITPTSQPPSATNPSVTLQATMYEYTGIQGKVGEMSTMDVTFANGGTAGPVWGTT